MFFVSPPRGNRILDRRYSVQILCRTYLSNVVVQYRKQSEYTHRISRAQLTKVVLSNCETRSSSWFGRITHTRFTAPTHRHGPTSAGRANATSGGNQEKVREDQDVYTAADDGNAYKYEVSGCQGDSRNSRARRAIAGSTDRFLDNSDACQYTL